MYTYINTYVYVYLYFIRNKNIFLESLYISILNYFLFYMNFPNLYTYIIYICIRIFSTFIKVLIGASHILSVLYIFN